MAAAEKLTSETVSLQDLSPGKEEDGEESEHRSEGNFRSPRKLQMPASKAKSCKKDSVCEQSLSTLEEAYSRSLISTGLFYDVASSKKSDIAHPGKKKVRTIFINILFLSRIRNNNSLAGSSRIKNP